MEKQAQQEAREIRAAPTEQQPEWSAPVRQAQSASRAAAILRLGGSLENMRPEDAIALGACIGNSAMHALIRSEKPVALEPFAYVPLAEQTEPFPIRADSPVLMPEAPAFQGDTGLTPFPAAALHLGGDGSPGWTGGAHE